MHRVRLSFLLLACLHGAGASAQSRVDVVGKATDYDARRDDTATRIVVGQDELRKYGDSTLADVLKRQPGIAIVGGMAGRGGEIRMRGLGQGYTQILLDGEPAPKGFTLDALAPELVERIEIGRVATADQSARAIAGTINFVLKRRVRKAERSLNLRAEHSNVFFSPSATLQVEDKAKDFSYALGVEVRRGQYQQDYTQREEGWNPSGTRNLLRSLARQNDGGFRMLALTPRLNWQLAGGDTLVASSFVQLQRSSAAIQGHWNAELGALPDYPNERNWPGELREQLKTDLAWTHALDGGARLEAKLGIEAGRQRAREHDAGYDPAWQPVFERDMRGPTDTRGVTSTGKYSRHLDAGHALSAGWEGSAQAIGADQDSTEREATVGSPLRESLHELRQLRARQYRLAAYVQDEWTLTPRWSAYLGLRDEALRTRSEGSDFAPSAHSANVLSPIVQTLWKLPAREKGKQQDQLRLAFSRTYRSEDLDRLVPRVLRSLNNTEVTPDRTGNPALRPELAWGIDLALEHYGSKGEQLSLSGNLRRIGDVVHDDTRFVDGRWLATPVNDGTARTRSIEFDARLPLHALLERVDTVDLHLNLARNWSSVSNVPGPDNRLAGQTPFTANTGIDWRAGKRFSSGANFTFRSAGPQRVSQTLSTYGTAKRELDIYALYKLTPTAQLRVTGANLLAEPATEITRYDDASGGLRSTSVYPFSAILRVALELKL